MATKTEVSNHRIAIIGLGYVGLPLLVAFSEIFHSIGFDLNKKRVKELTCGYDRTNEIQDTKRLMKSKFSTNVEDISACNIFIVTVPTPVKRNKHPDLTPIKSASKLIGKLLKPQDIVIYESTVYPGVTEEICVPILEQFSGLAFNKDFSCGYSPERINPADRVHTLTNITKIISASNKKALLVLKHLYGSIIKAGVYEAESIKVAEAAKVIENAQRDINIAFVNELAKIFKTLDIRTADVLKAASTKWNFLPFSPGMVGGHCIGIDPYYLSYKARKEGYNPQILLAGRKLNDSMSTFIGEDVLIALAKKEINARHAKILIMGVTFKENCPDIRNSKAFDLIKFFQFKEMHIDAYDPHADSQCVQDEYGFKMLPSISKKDLNKYQGIIFTVAHDEFKLLDLKLQKRRIIYDIKSFLKISDVTL
jgi:UDP-N-acetyl-D-glucosamine/UDP-N-acetyl-D-galactosamine dehydrogenase